VRMDRRLVILGIFFIVFGGVLLGARQGWIAEDVVGALWQLWPVLLIAAGISIVLSGRPGAWIGGAVAAACLGAMAAAIVQIGVIPFVGCGGNDQAGSPFEARSGELAADSRVRITFSCGDLDVATGSGTGWTLSGSSKDGKTPTVRQSDGDLELEPSSKGVFGFGGQREDWTVTLPTEPTIDLGLTVNAGSLSLDMRDAATMDTLDGTVNAGSSVVWLPDVPITGGFTVNAGSLVFCAPADLALRFDTGDNPISSNDFDQAGLVKTDEGWETPGFATAPIRTTLDVTANAGSLSLNPSEPCSR
jgi:LiaI-LiaF-like transmembrane region